MRSFGFYMNLRNFTRRKYFFVCIMFSGLLMFSLQISFKDHGEFENGRKEDTPFGHVGKWFLSDGAKVAGAMRHNRNLQNLYSRDANQKHKFKSNNDRINKDYSKRQRGDSIPMTAGHSNSGDFDPDMSESIDRSKTDPQKRLPKAIIIGVKKGGTRALLEFLRAHPNVRATGPEPHFFDKYYDKGIEWYRNMMPTSYADQITIEKTPGYFVSREVPKRVMNMSRDIKLIVVVRDPVVRAISDFAQVTSRLKKFKTFEQMVFIDNNTRMVDTSWAVIRIGLYAKHLQQWLQVFPLEQFHFVNGENLIKNPAQEMLTVQKFLGLDIVLTDKNFFTNMTRGFPCVRKRSTGKGHCLDGKKGRPHPYVRADVIDRLRDFYRPFNAKFYKLVGRSFNWP